MYLYNSLTRQKDEFKPREDGKVTMYTCGPTVYHFAHIGNLRTYTMEDVLEKYLAYSGYEVKRVMNITDVGHLTSDGDSGEDKMLKGAKREHKTVMQIAKFYTDAFFADCAKLHIKTPEVVEPATNCVPEFIRMVEELLEKHSGMPHGGTVIRRGVTGANSLSSHTMEFSLRLDSNPEFTGNMLVATARAACRMRSRGIVGCKTLFDIAPADLSIASYDEIRGDLL